MVLLSLSAGFNFSGILFCFCTVAMYSLYAPTLDSKIWCLVDQYAATQFAWTYPVLGILFLAAAFPFAAVRVSPVATLGAALPITMLLVKTRWVFGWGTKAAALQHTMARRLLKIDGGGVGKGSM